MPDIDRNILRLDQGRHHVQNVKMLGQQNQFPKVRNRSGPPAAFQIRGMGCSGARLKNQAAGFNANIRCGGAAAGKKGPRCRSDGRFDKIAPDEHHLIVFNNSRSRSLKDLPRFGQENSNAQILQNVQGSSVDRRNPVVRERAHHRKRIAQVAVIDLAFRFGF